MSEETDQLEREITRANETNKILNSPAFKNALIVRRAQIFEVFCNTTKDQEDVREEAWRTMKNMDALEEYFKEIMTTGKMAEDVIERDK